MQSKQKVEDLPFEIEEEGKFFFFKDDNYCII